MKHYGDITKISGYEVPAVEIITGGSPCQDLSVAGKRAGLQGERSGLFMEQLRIIKEMRENDRAKGRTNEFIRPRYMVWENVLGAFSSNKGEDFRAVLEETAKIVGDSVEKTSKFVNTQIIQRRFSTVNVFTDEIAPTLEAGAGEGGNNMPMVFEQTVYDASRRHDYTSFGHHMGIIIKEQEPTNWDGSQISPTLTSSNADGSQRMPDIGNFNAVVCFGIDRAAFNQGQNAKYNFSIEEEKIATLTAKSPSAVATSIVRRLTPLECERLQGYPDNWTNIGEWIDSKGKKHKDADSPRYKALGNSIALPFWEWMAKRMAKYLPDNSTMASLFDGIGGFPLVFSRAGIKPIWASEIEEFPIAVTKIRFPEN